MVIIMPPIPELKKLSIFPFNFCCFWAKGVSSLLRPQPAVVFVPWNYGRFLLVLQSGVLTFCSRESVGCLGFSEPGMDGRLLLEACL